MTPEQIEERLVRAAVELAIVRNDLIIDEENVQRIVKDVLNGIGTCAELERLNRVVTELLAYEEGLAKKVERAEAELKRLRSDLAAEEKEKLSWRHTVNAIAADRDKWQGQWETVKGVCEQRDAAISRAEQAEAELERLRHPTDDKYTCGCQIEPSPKIKAFCPTHLEPLVKKGLVP